MKTKIVVALLASTLWCISTFAQLGPAPSSTGNITAAGSTCNTTNACIILNLANSNVGYTVTVSGTFTATLQIEQTNDGANWTAVSSPTTATQYTSALIAGLTGVRVRCSAFTSGTAVVTITAGGATTLQTVAGGSSSSTSNPAPNMGFYLTNACLPANTNQCFNTFADTQQANDCSWTNASTTITCNSAHFVVADVGKAAMGFQTCVNDQPQSVATAGAISTTALVTISGFTDSTHVTVSATPGATATFQSAFPAGGCFIWGHLDDAAATALDTAMLASPVCPKLFLAAANYFFASPHFFTNPTACINISPGINGNFGNTTLPAGFEIEGRGVGTTAWFLAPSFPNGDACTHVPTNAGLLTPAHVGGCFAIPVMGKWQDFRIDGGGLGISSNLNNKTLIYAAVATIQNFSCLNLGSYNGSVVGIEMSNLVQMHQVNNAGCGNIGIWQDSGSGQSYLQRVITENNAANGLFIAGSSGTANVPSVTCNLCYFSMPQTPLTGFGAVRNNGGIFRWIGGTANPTNNVSTVGTTQSGYAAVGAGSVLYADQVNFIYNLDVAGGTHTNSAIVCTATCTNHLHDNWLGSQVSGFDIQDVAGSVEDDLGGNTGSGRFSISGSQVGDASVTGTTITAAKLVLSAGWGASAAWTALSGQTRSVQGTISNTGAGQAANPTIVYTFPTPFWSATNLICSAVQVGGTQGAILNTFTPSALTATGVTFTYNGTPTVGLTEIVQISCGVK